MCTTEKLHPTPRLSECSVPSWLSRNATRGLRLPGFCFFFYIPVETEPPAQTPSLWPLEGMFWSLVDSSGDWEPDESPV